jgi:hypothetical protein
MPNIGDPSTGRGDIQFLAHKEFNGKLVTDEGTLTAAGDLCTITANTGKDLYLAGAKLNWVTNAANFNMVAELKAGPVGSETVIETYRGTTIASLGTGNMQYEFKTKGIKVTAGENILIELTSFSSAGTEDCEGIIQGWEEDTGVSPDA